MPIVKLNKEELATTMEFVISFKCETFINNLLVSRATKHARQSSEGHHVIVIDDDSNQLVNSQMQDRWLMVDQLYLYSSGRDVLLNNKEWLNDNHMTCAQKLIKNQFPQYNGLQNTILRQTKFLKPLLKNALQILHTGENENNRNHWIAVSTVNCNEKEDIIVYDSKFSSSLSPDTLMLLAQVIKTEKSAICIKVANVTKQTGSSDCGRFAIAYITHIAFGMNPSSCVFQQSSTREHFLKCLED